MGKFSDELLFGMTIRESANDGSDFTNPAADYRRLFLGEDGLLHLRDSAGTITDIGSGSGAMATDVLWDAAGDLAQGTGANTGAKLSAGTAGKVLTSNGAAAALTWETPTGGFLGTLTEALLGADVTLTTADTFYDGPTTTPAAGVYDVWGRVTVAFAGAGNRYACGRLIANGSATPIDEHMQLINLASAGDYLSIILAARVTADGSNPILIRAAASNNGETMKRDQGVNSSSLHRATLLRLTRVS